MVDNEEETILPKTGSEKVGQESAVITPEKIVSLGLGCIVVSSALFLFFLTFWIFVLTTQLVPALYVAVGCIFSAIFIGAVAFLTRCSSRIYQKIIGYVLAALLAVVCVLGGFALWRTVQTMRAVSDTTVERSVVSFYALEGSSVATVNDLDGKGLGILEEMDRSNTDETIRKAEEEYGMTFSLQEYDSLISLADALQSDQVQGIVLNQAFLPLYEELSGYETFPSELRELKTQELERVLEHGVQAADSQDKEPLEDPVVTVLISGSDTRKSVVDQLGRSDVNIIAKINRETHEILLVSTPRDYYVPLAFSWGNPQDKLTHAGIYGMDVLMGTLEDLYDTQIDYYFRLNFVGFTEIIDALGGIEVYSDYDFTAGGHDYHVGINSLNGEEALSFARERYSFVDGDRQRGMNQMAVIEGVLQKAMSPSILTGYLDILESVQDCVDTSVPYQLMADMVQCQLSENASWHVERYSVNGSDASDYTFSMAQKLYVMIPDEATVQEAKEKLAALG